MNLKFCAFVQGGEGPEVWDKESCFEATDILEALKLANGWAEDHGGVVMSINQSNWDEKDVVAYRTKDHPEACGRKAVPGSVAYAMEFPLDDGRSLVLHMGGKCFDLLTSHLMDMLSGAPSHNDGSCKTM